METYERIRELRKEHLCLNQTEFGEKLGVSRSVIKNIELNALARPELKMSLYKLICSEFNVNEEWLLHGTGSMFAQPDAFSLDDFAKMNHASGLELEIIKTYFELDPDVRGTVVEHFKQKLAEAAASDPSMFVPDTAEELEKKYPPVDPGGIPEEGAG